MRYARVVMLLCAVAAPRSAVAQGAATTRLLILQAEERRALTPADLTVIRVNARSSNAETARIAIRALGRLERVSLIPDILRGLAHSLPEVRIETANALAQAAQGVRAPVPASANVVASTQAALITRLGVEADASVRGAICEALARLPYRTAAEAERAETAIVGVGARATALADRLGLAKALEAYVRIQAPLRPAGAAALSLLGQLARADAVLPGLDLLRDARVRRLALEGLLSAHAPDDLTIERAAEDADPQVRRLAMRAIGLGSAPLTKLKDGMADPVPMVRLEALRALRARASDDLCAASIKAAADQDMAVALVAIDQLGACGSAEDATGYLERTAGDLGDLAAPRGWHRNAHALVALAAAAPERVGPLLPSYLNSRVWQVRLCAARAAAQIANRDALDTLAGDVDRRVANVALGALGRPGRPADILPQEPVEAPITADEFRRLAAPRARVTIRDVGQFDLALFTTEAPGTVIRFARLAEAGYYNGLAFDRLAPNATVQGGERTERTTATYTDRETGTWPHVRGTVGLSAPDTGDAQFFINLVDNPRFDHQYTVFAQVLNGAEVVDRILEGDIIESIVIVP